MSLNSLTAQDKIIQRKESNKRIIINDSEKRKSETMTRTKQSLEKGNIKSFKEDKKEVGNIAFITKKGVTEENDINELLDSLSEIDDEQFEAELDLSLEAKTKILKEEMDRKAALEDLDK